MSTWFLADGTTCEGVEIKERTATGEYITVNGEKILVHGDVDVLCGENKKVNFTVYGLTSPLLWCTKSWNYDWFKSEVYSPIIFESEWKKYLKRPEFQGEVGRLLIKRLPAILNYKFEL